ncbi:hypothetical protein QMK17_06225 [Rhodococcus sp. G-MC3]|uniref:hypothetical protein n=1 Tax=Rhodococcus sp. G-MC3 TaxID=3046209 RepID=UPI0024B8DBA0|nr:hypothetical protein [Rhodococcus sp. G-MC3]MDJ0392926.1 hypothetical protein [Rhodococcus sp. G-MC3]
MLTDVPVTVCVVVDGAVVVEAVVVSVDGGDPAAVTVDGAVVEGAGTEGISEKSAIVGVGPLVEVW